ncbi:MAG: PBP1A family penicillin-binding protein [Lachnospiraceae bacterium]|nr:PBP1A family penicillin-binding protein [Lachnospiraceae bacterium]
MNYGKNGATKRDRQLSANAPKVANKFILLFWKVLLVAIVALLVAGITGGIGIFKGVIASAPAVTIDDATPTGYLSTVLDTDGNVTATLVASGSNRVYATIDEIPEDLQHAFVAIEDERFYEHNGIDIYGIVRAGITGITSGRFSQGASTLTQQLIKNNVFTDWTSETSLADKLERKIQEQYLAIELEKKVTKDWIMENYLNTINLGQNTLGVQAASSRYFGKDVSELTLSECAVIAAITQNPSKYNPISHPEDNAERREKVLKNMLSQGYITQEEFDEAMADDVYSRIQIVNGETLESGDVSSYFVDELTDQVIQDLMDLKGYTETQAYKALYNGGLTIYSTQNSSVQSIVDEEVNNLENYPTQPEYSFSYRLTVLKADGSYENYSEATMLSYYQAANSDYDINFASQEEAAAAIEAYKAEILEEGDTIPEGYESVVYTLQPQVALTIMNHETGEVVAMAGGRGDKTASKTLNRATDTTRQPGSTFKILAAYAPALDYGGMTLASVEDDAPYSYENGTSLKNYDNSYRGWTTFREAITNSINIVTVKALTEVGVDVGFRYIQDFGFTTIVEDDNVQSLALGGLTNGVKNLELTAAYATIANSGTYIKPRFYTKILDHDGNVLIDNTPQEKTVLKESTAWLLTNAMEDVVTSGTGTAVNFGNMAIAGKTGTTTKNRDALFAGFTPYYTCVVWGGYDDNTPQASGTTSYPKAIWKAVMSRLHENLEYKDFEMPDSIVTAQVCKKSGKLAISGVCEADPRGSMVITEYFDEATVPTEYCDHHCSLTICAESGYQAGDYCPMELRIPSVYILGGDAGSADDPYRISLENATTLCPVHGGVIPAAPSVINPSSDTAITTTPAATTDAATGTTDAATGTTDATAGTTDATTGTTDATAGTTAGTTTDESYLNQ